MSDGHLLLLQQMIGPDIPLEVTFATTHFWVKASDVPGKKQTTSFAQIHASNIGELVSYDEATTKGVDKALCFCIDINLSKPLRRGINVIIAKKPIWIWFKCVKVPDF